MSAPYSRCGARKERTLKPYKACSCRDPETKRLLGKKCPKLTSAQHGKWYARYEAQKAPNGRRRQPRIGPYDSPEECAAALTQVIHDGPTVNEILDDYMGHLTCADKTRDNYRRSLRYVRSTIGEHRAQHVDKDDIDRMVKYLLTRGKRDGTGLSKRTVDMAVGLLRASYELAVFRERLRRRSIPVDSDPGVIPL